MKTTDDILLLCLHAYYKEVGRWIEWVDNSITRQMIVLSYDLISRGDY